MHKERENLKKYYPMFFTLLSYMAGRTEKDPQCQDFGNGLLTVYDYFAMQVEWTIIRRRWSYIERIWDLVSPVCSNVHFIRITKIYGKQISNGIWI